MSPCLQLCPALCQSSCSLSTQLYWIQCVLSAELLQSLQQCNPSALAYSVVQFICFKRPAVKPHLSYELRLSKPVCSVMVSQLGSNLLTQSVSSAAMCQFSCTLLAQIKLVSSATRSAATFWLSWSMSSFALCPLVAMNTDIWKRQSGEACHNHVAHCYADALLQIFTILAKQICKWALSRMARIISESYLE